MHVQRATCLSRCCSYCRAGEATRARQLEAVLVELHWRSNLAQGVSAHIRHECGTPASGLCSGSELLELAAAAAGGALLVR